MNNQIRTPELITLQVTNTSYPSTIKSFSYLKPLMFILHVCLPTCSPALVAQTLQTFIVKYRKDSQKYCQCINRDDLDIMFEWSGRLMQKTSTRALCDLSILSSLASLSPKQHDSSTQAEYLPFSCGPSSKLWQPSKVQTGLQ